MKNFGKITLTTLVVLAGTASVQAAEKPAASPGNLVVLPASVVLDSRSAVQRLVVERNEAGAYRGDLTAKTRLVSSNPKVATVDALGMVRPVADGTATITAVSGSQRASAAVRVQGTGKPFRWSFANHVQPVLTKTGCNSGACHGAS